MSDLIRREDVFKALGITDKSTKYGGDHSGYNTLMLYEIKGAIDSIPNAETTGVLDDAIQEYIKDGYILAEPLVTVKAKQNEGLYLNTDEETLLETEYIVVATDGMYKEYIHETDGKPRRGKWIDHPTVENIGLVDLQGNEMEIVIKMCSECGYEGWETNYCPNCGAKMERSE